MVVADAAEARATLARMEETTVGDDERYERERAHHDERFAANGGTRRSTRFYAVAGDAKGDYRTRVLAARPGQRVLEYGCGTGSEAFELAAAGVDVTGIDISDVAVQVARDRAELEGAHRARFEVMNAEHLDVPDDSIDLVCGSGILHHLDLDRSLAEIARVLTPGGRAVFFEPLGHNPVVNLYRRATPDERTDDEHPLLERDLVAMGDRFGSVHATAYDLFALAALPLRRVDGVVRACQRLDRVAFARWPRLQRWAWTVVLELADPGAAVRS